MENNQYIETVDDGLPMRKSGQWVCAKLFYISRYMQMFVKALSRSPWRSIRYIDLFAGPGKCYIEDTGEILLGSPLLALTTPIPFTDYVFIDINTENLDGLRKRALTFNSAARISFINGDCNLEVRNVVDKILLEDSRRITGKWGSINLALLDPTGLQIDWNTIVELARARTDLIIHYSQFGLTRNLDLFAQESGDTIIDNFFGTREWRKIYAKHVKAPGEIHSKLLELYHSQLTSLGYVDINGLGNLQLDPLIKTSQTNAPLYRLIFASKNRLGHKFWAEVTKKDVHGQTRFC